MIYNHKLSRRGFLKGTAALGAQALLLNGGLRLPSWAAASDSPLPLDLAVVTGESPARNCLAAVEALGGFSRFVKPGQRVAIKPNPIGTSPPHRALNTHPEMIETVVRGCLQAGAREVVVFSNDGLADMVRNGTEAAVQRGGGVLKAVETREFFREVPVPRGRVLRSEMIAADLLDADVFINMPIAKHHAQSTLTCSMKNLMGANFDRLRFHRSDLHQCIAELTGAVRHDLVIMDANHVLLTNGPAGPGRVARPSQVVAGVDPVAIDAFATRYFDLTPADIPHILDAHELGVGEMDLGKLRIGEFGG